MFFETGPVYALLFLYFSVIPLFLLYEDVLFILSIVSILLGWIGYYGIKQITQNRRIGYQILLSLIIMSILIAMGNVIWFFYASCEDSVGDVMVCFNKPIFVVGSVIVSLLYLLIYLVLIRKYYQAAT